MTRTAIYHATPGHIVEQPAWEASVMQDYAWYYQFDEAYDAYTAHLATLRTIPAHDSARSLWKDGQLLTEYVDYVIRDESTVSNNEDGTQTKNPPKFVAFPLPVKGEDDLWKEFMDDIWDMTGISLFERTMTMAKIQQKYIITKR